MDTHSDMKESRHTGQRCYSWSYIKFKR